MTTSGSTPCQTLERQLADYLAGVLPVHVAEAHEVHAASCAVCEARLEAATRREVRYAPALPFSLRHDTLLAVRAQRSAVPAMGSASAMMSSRWRWRGGLATLAAAAVVVVFVMRGRDRGPNDSVLAADTRPTATVAVDSPPGRAARTAPQTGAIQTASQLAEMQAKSEFDELDAATQELEAALAASPTDRELRGFLSTVRARRDELSRRVKEATS